MSTVEVRIIVKNANGKDADVTVKDFIRLGNSIPEKINVVAAEAAALAYQARDFDRAIRRDRTSR